MKCQMYSMNKYYKYKNIFSGAISIDDMIFLRNKCPECDYYIIDSITGTHLPQSYVGCTQMNKIVEHLVSLKYKEECTKYLEDYINNIAYSSIHRAKTKNFTNAQNDTITKIISMKPKDETIINLPNIEKACPHCGRINKAPIGTKYIVCGIDSLGITPIDNFDNACLNDWCFSCGKKLCKNWYADKLYDEKNRTHTAECCKKHASEHGRTYQTEYCQCSKYDSIIDNYLLL